MAALDQSPVLPGHGRAGRNLPVAIGVGLALGAVITVPLFTYKPVFVGVVVAAIALGIREVVRSLRVQGLRAPVVPLLVGGVATDVAAYTGGPEALLVAALLTVLAVFAWRLPDGPAGYLADVAAGGFTAVYVAFLAGFCLLLTAPDDGPLRVTTFIATTVCSDVGGYAAGVLVGRHPMAPRVSPKKSWEGLAGSALACVVAGVVFLQVFYDNGSLLEGVAYGLAIAASATLGDLGESLLKRDLGIKDMGTLLPGHGGIMDRLDSLLPTAPVAWLLLTAFVPPH